MIALRSPAWTSPKNSQFFFLWKAFHKEKNWIHLGSKEAGPRVAAIISVIETCRRLKIPLCDYLGSVLPRLADFQLAKSPS
jgi:hypothetical protein